VYAGLLLLLSACGQGATLPAVPQTVARTPTLGPPAPTDTPIPTPAPTVVPITDRVLQVAENVYPDIYFKQEGSSGPDVRYHVNVTLLAHTDPSDPEQYKYIAYTVYKALWQDPDLANRLSSVLILMISTDNVVPTEIYAKVYLTQETAKKIDWGNLGQDDNWGMYNEQEVISF